MSPSPPSNQDETPAAVRDSLVRMKTPEPTFTEEEPVPEQSPQIVKF